MTGSPALNTVLFDLDGTLVDTAPDLAATLNDLLAEQQQPSLPFADIRPHVSHGASALVSLGFRLDSHDSRFEPLRERFLALYQQRLTEQSRLFPGMADLLQALEQRRLNWGVVTNKPARFTEPLLAGLGLLERAACVVSGDSAEQRKPHPQPMLLACRQVGSTAQQCLYVGDAQRDIEAGQRAGMKTLVALFGYLGERDEPTQWQADGMIEEPAEILDWLIDFNNKRTTCLSR